jgi:hypothetical protein
MESKLTHRGWLLFCPIYMADIDTGNPLVVPRHWVLNPVLWLAAKIQEIAIGLCSMLLEDYEPVYWFMITGELE